MIDPIKSASQNFSSSIRQSIPIRAGFRTELDAVLRKCLSKIAEQFLENEPTLCSTQYFGSRVNCGLHNEGPALLIADQSKIALFGEPGDMLALSHDRNMDFEAYLGDYLGVNDLMDLPPRPFQGALNALRDLLFRQGSREGIVFLTPTSYEIGSGAHYMAIAETLERARELSRQTNQRLMG